MAMMVEVFTSTHPQKMMKMISKKATMPTMTPTSVAVPSAWPVVISGRTAPLTCRVDVISEMPSRRGRTEREPICRIDEKNE
ncbi:hypothetical protein D3C87_1998850 [compost metagenome]